MSATLPFALKNKLLCTIKKGATNILYFCANSI